MSLSDLCKEMILTILKFCDGEDILSFCLGEKKFLSHLNQERCISQVCIWKLGDRYGYDYLTYGPESYENFTPKEHYDWSLKVGPVVDQMFMDIPLPGDERLSRDVKGIMIDHMVIGGPNKHSLVHSVEVAEEIINDFMRSKNIEFDISSEIDDDKLEEYLTVLALPDIRSLG